MSRSSTKISSNWSDAECIQYLAQWRVELDAQRVDLEKQERDYAICKAQFINQRINTIDVAKLAARLSNAYSTDRYRNGWSACIRMLIKRGYNEKEIEAIIRSKWTRYAADMSPNQYGYVTGADLARFLDTHARHCCLEDELKRMVAETVGELV